jgi:hypothetical protein
MTGSHESQAVFAYSVAQIRAGRHEVGQTSTICKVASYAENLDDLACMKLSDIAQRGLRKDFCDIYFLGTKHRPLQDLLSLYRQKFNVQDISPVLYGLSYFDNAEQEPMPLMLLAVQWKTIKKTLQGWIRELGKI